MSNTISTLGSLGESDIDLIERIIYKNSDEVSVCLDRGLERLADHLDSTETRVYSRLSDIEEKIDDSRQFVVDALEAIREEIRELRRSER